MGPYEGDIERDNGIITSGVGEGGKIEGWGG